MPTFITLIENEYRIKVEDDQYSLQKYTEEYMTKSVRGSIPRLKPPAWEGLSKYFPTVLQACEYVIRAKSDETEGECTLQEYIDSQKLLWATIYKELVVPSVVRRVKVPRTEVITKEG